MPVHTSLVHVLLLWITILSIVQIVFITYFFTAGHNDLPQNSSAVEPQPKMQSLEAKPPSSSDSGKMLSFKATKVNSSIEWVSVNPNTDVIVDVEENLEIQKDGYYFLSLRVTLCMFEGMEQKLEHKVHLIWKNNLVLLEGWINSETKSTGQLSKVTELSAKGNLTVSITPPATCFQDSETVTYLDVIYMSKK